MDFFTVDGILLDKGSRQNYACKNSYKFWTTVFPNLRDLLSAKELRKGENGKFSFGRKFGKFSEILLYLSVALIGYRWEYGN